MDVTFVSMRLLQISFLVSLAALATCREAPEEQEANRGSEPRPPSVDAPVELTPDEKLAEAVRHAMLQAPALARENIRIAVVQQQVFLAGEVSAPHLRDEAVAVAGEVPGVQGVQSKINVKRR